MIVSSRQVFILNLHGFCSMGRQGNTVCTHATLLTQIMMRHKWACIRARDCALQLMGRRRQRFKPPPEGAAGRGCPEAAKGAAVRPCLCLAAPDSRRVPRSPYPHAGKPARQD